MYSILIISILMYIYIYIHTYTLSICNSFKTFVYSPYIVVNRLGGDSTYKNVSERKRIKFFIKAFVFEKIEFENLSNRLEFS